LVFSLLTNSFRISISIPLGKIYDNLFVLGNEYFHLSIGVIINLFFLVVVYIIMEKIFK
jgi:hypothetical protein